MNTDLLSGCEISLFEAKLNASRSQWLEFQKAWDERFDLQPFINGLGMLVGAIASALMGGNDIPFKATTSLVAAWSYNSCRRTLTAKPPPPPPQPPPDPCECCSSDFQPLIWDQFEDCKPDSGSASGKEETFSCNCETDEGGSSQNYEPPLQPDNEGNAEFTEYSHCTCNGR